MIIVGELWKNGEQKLIASAAFFKTKIPSTAEIALVVNEKWRRYGIGRFLLEFLIKIARELNVKYFSGTVLLENTPMLHLLHDSGYPLISKSFSYGEVDFKFDISKIPS